MLLVLVFPLLGIRAYLIVRGDKMRTHQLQTIEAEEESFRRYVQSVAGARRRLAEELAQLAELWDRGELTADEYRILKEQILHKETAAA